VKEYIYKLNFQTSFVYNVDETRTEPRDYTAYRLACPDREGRVVFAPPSDLRTTFNVISADGTVWLTLYIYKDGVVSDPEKSGTIPTFFEIRPLRGSWPVLYAKTEKGFMNQQLFSLVLNHLVDLVDIQRGNLPILLFADRPGCHDSLELVKTLFNRNTHLIWFPANTSQFLQPLDGTPYATMKKNIRKDRDDEMLKRSVTGDSLNQIVAEISPYTERESFTKDVVLSGFVDRGIWPFNPSLILELAKKEFLRSDPDVANSAVALEAQNVLSFFMTNQGMIKC